MPRSRRAYGKVNESPSSTEQHHKNKQQHDDALTKLIDGAPERRTSSKNTTSTLPLSLDASSSGLLSTETSVTKKRPFVTNRRKRHKKGALRETTNLHPKHVSTDDYGVDRLFPSIDHAKKKHRAGDEITPRTSNCNKIKQQKQSFEESHILTHCAADQSVDRKVPSPVSNHCVQADDMSKDAKKDQSEPEDDDCSGMDCSSDSLGLESPDDINHRENKINSLGALPVDALDTKADDNHTTANIHTKSAKRHIDTMAEKLYPDSILVDSSGCPIVSKGLMKRALTVQADDESVLQVLMNSCGGSRNQRSRRVKRQIQSSASSILSDITLSSSTLLGAMIPLTRCDSFDSTLTFDTYGKYENGQQCNDRTTVHSNIQDMNECVSHALNAGIKQLSSKKPTHSLSEPAVVQKEQITSSRNQPQNKSTIHENTQNGEIHNIHSRKADTQDYGQRDKYDHDDGTVQTIDSEHGSVVTHPKLPPGWRVKVSRSKNQVYYVHPDFGSTWHCPVVAQKPIQIQYYHKKSEQKHIREYSKNTKAYDADFDEGNRGGKFADDEKRKSIESYAKISCSSHYVESDNDPSQEILLAQKSHKKFIIYEDPVPKDLPKNIQEEPSSTINQRQHEKSISKAQFEENQSAMVTNILSTEQSPPLHRKDCLEDGIKQNENSDAKSPENDTDIIADISSNQEFLQNQSVSEQSSISNTDSSPRYLDFSNEIESEVAEDATPDRSNTSHNQSEETVSERSHSSSRSDNLSHVSSGSMESNHDELTIQNPVHDHIRQQRETLADRMARLHHPLCSLQRLDEILRDKRVRKVTASSS